MRHTINEITWHDQLCKHTWTDGNRKGWQVKLKHSRALTHWQKVAAITVCMQYHFSNLFISSFIFLTKRYMTLPTTVVLILYCSEGAFAWCGTPFAISLPDSVQGEHTDDHRNYAGHHKQDFTAKPQNNNTECRTHPVPSTKENRETIKCSLN